MLPECGIAREREVLLVKGFFPRSSCGVPPGRVIGVPSVPFSFGVFGMEWMQLRYIVKGV